jgi:quercetin dioxygenase-like cupin family protein
MFGKRAVLVGLMTTALVASAAAVAIADAGAGEHRELIARGQSAHSFGIQQRKENDVVTNKNAFDPGGFSGWHSHPGTAVFVVQSGH